MKIILSLNEVQNIVRQSLNLPAECLIEVGPTHSSEKERFENEMRQNGYLDLGGEITPDKKISAIKLLRGMISGMGLAEAKNAVENWKNFLNFIEQNGSAYSSNYAKFPWLTY